MDKRTHTLEKAGLAIPGVLAEHKLLVPYKLYQAKLNWQEIAGPQIAKYSYIKDFQKGVVTIAVLNPVWMNQLFMYKQNIIRNINDYIQEQAVQDIHFIRSGRKPGKVVYETTTGEEDEHVPTIPIRSVILPEEVVQTIRRETAHLPEALREKMAQLRFAQAKRVIAYRHSGFTQCPQCGRWLAKGETLCLFCRLQKRQNRKKEIHDILIDMPWLTWDEMISEGYAAAHDKKDEELYNEVRRDLIYQYIEKIHHDVDSLADDLCLAMLITRQKPTALEPEFIHNLTEKYRRKDHVPAHRQSAADCHQDHRRPDSGPSDTTM